MKVGLFFQSSIPQGNGTAGNFTSMPKGLSWFEYLLFALFNHLQFGESGNRNNNEQVFQNTQNPQMQDGQNLPDNAQNQFKEITEFISQFQSQMFAQKDEKLNLQNIEHQELIFQNKEPQGEEISDSEGNKKQAELMLFLPFIFRLAQDKQGTSEEKEGISSEIAFLNRQILKDICLKGMPDEKHLIALAKRLKDFTADKMQLADTQAMKDMEKIDVENGDVKEILSQFLAEVLNEKNRKIGNKFVTNKIDGGFTNKLTKLDKMQLADTQAMKDMEKIDVENGDVKEILSQGGKFITSRPMHMERNSDGQILQKFARLALNEKGVFDYQKKEIYKDLKHLYLTQEKKEVIFGGKFSQSFQEARVENSVEKGVEESIARGKNQEFKNNSIEGRFLQAYFSVQKDFQPASLEQQFAMASKQNPQSLHKVHLNELASFIKDFSVELLPEGEKVAHLDLEPPELGRLELEVKVKDKKVEIVAKVEKLEALHEIRHHLHQIKTHFEEAGLQLKDFQLSLAENLAGGGEFLADKKGEGKSSDRNKEQTNVEIAGVENEAGETMPLINQKGSYYYIA